MARRLFCELYVDEGVAGDIGVIDYVEQEFGYFLESGIGIGDVIISDEDDESIGARYCQYLIEWAIQHHEDEDIGDSNLPMSFDVFVEGIKSNRMEAETYEE